MSTPKNTEELVHRIDEVVKLYMAEAHRVASEALERAFQRTAAPPPNQRKKPSGSKSTVGKRRASEELEQLEARLLELVRSRPGESMATFVAELAMPAKDLQRPMSLLKQKGRVRSVGQRRLTRYFPAVGSRNSAAS